MSLNIEEANETQQLMQHEREEDDQKAEATSPVTSTKISSGAASLTSKNPQTLSNTGNISLNDSTKISYINERRNHRDFVRTNINRPKHIPKETPDVKHMEKALMELLDDFHTGKLSAFGSGCSMEQMISIRDQQEHLARLHFRLYGEAEKLSDDSFETSTSKDKMAQLVQSLEQLSTSIELLQSNGLNVNNNRSDN